MPQEFVDPIKQVAHIPTMQALALANRYIDNARQGFVREQEAGNPIGWAKAALSGEIAKASAKLTEARQHGAGDENALYLAAALEASLHELQARAAMALDNAAEAVRHLDAALSIDTQNAELYATKARCLMRLNRRPDALQMAETALALDPAETDYMVLVEEIKSTSGFAGFMGSKGGDTVISAADGVLKAGNLAAKGLGALGGFFLRQAMKK